VDDHKLSCHVLHAASYVPDNFTSNVRCVCSFVKQYLGAPVATDLDTARAEVAELQKKNEELQAQIASLQGGAEGAE